MLKIKRTGEATTRIGKSILYTFNLGKFTQVETFSFVDHDMMMRYHWGHMPGHLYMHQIQRSTGFSGAGSMGQERVSANDEAQGLDPDEPANGEGAPNKCTQMGSDSDDSDRDFDPKVDLESGDESSSSENSRLESKECSLDNNNDEWGAESMYED